MKDVHFELAIFDDWLGDDGKVAGDTEKELVVPFNSDLVSGRKRDSYIRDTVHTGCLQVFFDNTRDVKRTNLYADIICLRW